MFKKVLHIITILVCGCILVGCSMLGGEDKKSGVITTQAVTVSFDTNGGNTIEPLTIEKGTDISDITWPTPVRNGYDFKNGLIKRGKVLLLM